jgi:hypothetical protein
VHRPIVESSRSFPAKTQCEDKSMSEDLCERLFCALTSTRLYLVRPWLNDAIRGRRFIRICPSRVARIKSGSLADQSRCRWRRSVHVPWNYRNCQRMSHKHVFRGRLHRTYLLHNSPKRFCGPQVGLEFLLFAEEG